MNGFIGFMASTAGRVLRVVAGIALIIWGLTSAGTVVAIIGVLPLLAGALDFCVLAPLFGYPMSGPKIRAARA
jgi:hypothetical protein